MNAIDDMIQEEKEKQIARGVATILDAIGASSQELTKTPTRAAKMLMEMLAYTTVSNAEIAEKFSKTFVAPKHPSIVTVENIRCFSFCEHHLALIYDMEISVRYLPKARVLGLSKIARIADAVCRRPQLQERISSDIYEVLSAILGTDDIEIAITAKHSCINARGVNKLDSQTTTRLGRGIFANSHPEH